MTSERIQRRIDALLDEADDAVARKDWGAVRASAETVLGLDPENSDAIAFLRTADRMSGAPESATTEGAPSGATTKTEALVPSQPTSFVGGRYHVRRFLGEGGKKRVFLAHDQSLDRDVAFALIKTEGLDATGRQRIVREAQAMGRLGAHPHVVTIFEIGEEGPSTGSGQAGAPYVVTELLGGGDVEGLLEEANGPLPLARALQVAKDVCDGLVFAHAQGIVHRDLKPGNVWLTADGVAKIGDFGLAVALNRSRLTQHGLMVGTVAYMPPEQALGGEVTPQADLYSFGAMLYELVTGRPPFVGDDPTGVISQHINTPPVAPSYQSEHCPPELETLILQLLAKVPADRPASAREVLDALERIDPDAPSASHSGASTHPLDRLASGVFVGRARELERLRAAFDDAFGGRGSVVMLVGEPGVGKTRTTRELETYARMRGAKVVWGRANEASGAPAFWPWIQAGREYGAQTPAETLTEQLRDYALELQRLFPGIRDRFPGLQEPPATDTEEAQFALFDAFSAFFRTASADVPVVFVLDDLHWADRPTLRLLTHLSREIARSRLLIVGTYRDTDLDRAHPLADALGEMNREQLFSRILLRGLSEAETASYIAATTNIQPSAELARRIHVETEGNPFFLSEVVNLMAEEGTLTSHSISDVHIPQGVREALGRRLDRLTPAANELLSNAAVIGREFGHALLAALSASDEDELLQLVEEALKARVIEETGAAGEYRFTHALMQETLLEELSTARRVRMHGRIAETLEAEYGASASEYASELARHYCESAVMNRRHAAQAARYSQFAAERAQSVAAWDETVRHYRACLAVVEDERDALGIDEVAVRSELAQAERFAGELDAGWTDVQHALQLAAQREESVKFAQAAVYAGDFFWQPPEVLLAIADRALAMLGDLDPHLRGLLLYRRAQWLVVTGSAGAEEAAAIAMEVASAGGYRDVLERLHFLRAATALHMGDPAGAALIIADRLNGATGPGTDYHMLAAGGRLFAQALAWSGNLDRAEAAATDALMYARSIRYPVEQAMSLSVLVEIAILRADRTRCEAWLAELVNLSARPTSAMMVASYYSSLSGDLARATSEIDEAFRSAVVDGGLRLRLRSEAARLRLLAGDRTAAKLRADEWAEMRSQANILGYLGFWLSLAALSEMTSLVDPALLVSVYGSLRGASTIQSIGARSADAVRGYLALALDLKDEAESHFRAGLAWCERERCPIEAGRCWQGLAELAEQRGEHSLAAKHLDTAGELFSTHGAKLYLDHVLAKKQILKA